MLRAMGGLYTQKKKNVVGVTPVIGRIQCPMGSIGSDNIGLSVREDTIIGKPRK